MQWLHTSCDGCGDAGLRILVPENTDGSVAGKPFPSLCKFCHAQKPKRDEFEKRLQEEERRSK